MGDFSAASRGNFDAALHGAQRQSGRTAKGEGNGWEERDEADGHRVIILHTIGECPKLDEEQHEEANRNDSRCNTGITEERRESNAEDHRSEGEEKEEDE